MQNVRATLATRLIPPSLTLSRTLLRRLFCSLSRHIKFNETTQTTVAVFSERYRVHPFLCPCLQDRYERVDERGERDFTYEQKRKRKRGIGL